MTKQGQAYIAIEPLKVLPREIYDRGVRVETTELHRQHPRLKSTTFIGRSESERKHIAQQGIFEALLVKNGEILEGMTSNFFYVKYLRAERNEPKANVVEARASSAWHQPRLSAQHEVVLGTAKDNILLGITRQTVIDLAMTKGIKVKYQPLKRNQLSAADETFITSSSRGIVPVIQIDDVTIGQGSPGPVTRKLLEAYERYVIQKTEII
jgi:branched-subunit amino acid aminotransferase/4-amino-4-deoxychorismate lyase